jgi:hypothetical protein
MATTKKKEPSKKKPKDDSVPPRPSATEIVLERWDEDLIGKDFKKEWLSDARHVGQLLRFLAGMHGRILDSTFFIKDVKERRKAIGAIQKEQTKLAWEIAHALAPPSVDLDTDLMHIAGFLAMIKDSK